jgi:hypothetical protein
MPYNIPLATKEKMRETHLFHRSRAEEKKTRKTAGTKKTRKAPNMYQNKSTVVAVHSETESIMIILRQCFPACDSGGPQTHR